jgi:hypothetical protein
VAFGELRRQLDYKTGWYGSKLVVVDRWLPSSKTCSACGARKAKLALSQRTYQCEECGAQLDRDTNAALNIAAAAATILAQSDDGPVPLAKPKPGCGVVDWVMPDACDKRVPEASYRVLTEPGMSGAEVGRPKRPRGAGHPSGVIRWRSHARPPT